jgi:NAD(P)H-binding
MFLVLGITGKVGGATAEHLLAHGKQVRALVRNREKASIWANQGVELVDGDWNDSAAIERALKGVEGAFVMLPAVWAPSPDYKEAKGVIANYVEALIKVAPPRVVALSSMGANRTSGLGMITAEIANRICARRWILRKLPLRLAGRTGRNVTGLLQSDKPEIDHGRDERHRRGGRNPFNRASVVRAARRRAWFDGHRG